MLVLILLVMEYNIRQNLSPDYNNITGFLTEKLVHIDSSLRPVRILKKHSHNICSLPRCSTTPGVLIPS